MNATLKRFVLVALTLVMVFSMVGVSSIYAQGPDNSDGQPEGDRPDGPAFSAIRLVYQTAADALGVDVREMIEAAEEGQTLNDILAAGGVDPVLVAADAKAAIEAEINLTVAEGRISEERAETLIGQLDTILDNVMSREVPQRRDRDDRRDRHPDGNLPGIVAENLGFEDARALVEAWRNSDQTIAEFITANGGNLEAVRTALTTTLTEQINQALEEGKLDQERATEMQENLESHIDEFLNGEPGDRQDRRNDRRNRRPDVNLLNIVAENLEFEDARALAEAWRNSDQTIAEFITANGGDLEAVRTALTTALSERINQGLEEGKLDQERAEEMLENLESHIDEFFNNSPNDRPERGDGPPPAGGEGDGVLE